MSTTVPETHPAQPSLPPHNRPKAVSISHVSKTFKLPNEQFHTFKERVLHPRRARQHDLLRATQNISLDIYEGEFFGIVGRNGSGKSTLLKCIAGIYEIDQGSIEIRGRLSPFIELGVGFSTEMAARDNVLINAIMLGLSRKQAQERFDAIIEFAELQEFVDLKLKNYSSGMLVRLAFSVAVQVDAEILLMDEVLAVGDASFQRKCFDEFTRLKAEGRTIILVTHDMSSVEKFCDRAMLIERGQVVDIGAPDSIARQYNDINFKRARRQAFEDQQAGTETAEPELEQARAQLRSAVFEDADGTVTVTVEQGQRCTVRLEAQINEPLKNPAFAIWLRNERAVNTFGADTQLGRAETGHFERGETAVVRFRFDNWLAPGRYQLGASVHAAGVVGETYDLREGFASIIVLAPQSGGGIVDLPHSFEVERG